MGTEGRGMRGLDDFVFGGIDEFFLASCVVSPEDKDHVGFFL